MPETEAVTQSTEGEPALWNAAVRLQARTVKEARHVGDSVAQSAATQEENFAD